MPWPAPVMGLPGIISRMSRDALRPGEVLRSQLPVLLVGFAETDGISLSAAVAVGMLTSAAPADASGAFLFFRTATGMTTV